MDNNLLHINWLTAIKICKCNFVLIWYINWLTNIEIWINNYELVSILTTDTLMDNQHANASVANYLMYLKLDKLFVLYLFWQIQQRCYNTIDKTDLSFICWCFELYYILSRWIYQRNSICKESASVSIFLEITHGT